MIDIVKLAETLVTHLNKVGWDLQDYNQICCPICETTSTWNYCPHCGTKLQHNKTVLQDICDGLAEGLRKQKQ